jgi:hypothetical protein
VNSDNRPTAPAVLTGRSGSRRPTEQSRARDSVLLSADARRLARAAIDLDTDLITRLVQESLDEVGAISTWERLVQPVWRYLGSRPDYLDEGSTTERGFVQSAMSVLSAAHPRHL